MKFILATLAAYAVAETRTAATADLKVTGAGTQSVTAGLKFDATYTQVINADGGQTTTSRLITTATRTLAEQAKATETFDYLVCANDTGKTSGACVWLQCSTTANVGFGSFAQSLPTDKAAAEAIFAGATTFWASTTLEAASSKWDAAKKVCTAVNKDETIYTYTKAELDAAKALADSLSSLSSFVSVTPVTKPKTTIITAVGIKEDAARVTAYSSVEQADNPFALAEDLATAANGASALALGAVAVAFTALAF